MTSAPLAAVFTAVLGSAFISGCAPSAVGQSGGGTFLSQNDLQVIDDPRAPGQFEVLTQAGNGGSDYWCAAGDYVVRRLNLGPTTRVFLVKPYGRSQIRTTRNSIGYSVSPSAEVMTLAAVNSGRLTMSMNKIGENYTAAHGRNVCPKTNRRRF